MAFAHILLLCKLLALVHASPSIDGLDHTCYGILRDFNIFFLDIIRANVQTDTLMACSRDPRKMWRLTTPADAEALTYAIDQVNSRTELLPNISLGFFMGDYCASDLTGLALSQYILPDRHDTNYFTDGELITCKDGYKRIRNVLGMLGPGFSRTAVMNVGLLSIYHIPSILTYATSDDLSDKSRFPYSMRLVSPDKFQADAITDLLVRFGWTYASLLYIEGSYGENGAKQIQKNAKSKGICLAFTYMFPSVASEDDAVEAVDKLIKHRAARVVLTVMGKIYLKLLGNEMLRRGETGYYIMIGFDAFHYLPELFGKVTDRSLAVRFTMAASDDFRRFSASRTPENSQNPWLPPLWEKVHDCRWDAELGERSCAAFRNMPSSPPLASADYPEMVIDGVYIYANALHALIENTCPEAFADKSLLSGCVKGSLLLQYLRNTSISGYLGKIRFDENGDFKGSYVFSQYHNDTGDVVAGAVWSRLTGSLIVNYDKMKWFSNLKNKTGSQTLPESVCSKSCHPKQYYIQRELPCCWDCRECRNNEIIVKNKTACEVCKLLSWPDEETLTFCVEINPTVLLWTDAITLALAAIAALGLSGCIATSLIFIKNRKAKIIKASSQQLMGMILFGMALAYITALSFLLEPTRVSCYICRFGFNLAVSLIYAPLVVKTSRVYRIFEAGKRGTKRPTLVGTKSQIIMVIVLVIIQLLLCVASVLIASPEPVSRMPVQTEKYVETLCSLPLSTLLPPLSFNLVLIVFCAAFGFMTRKLPENFNESWYIFVSVATTTFLWLVFLPAYFTAFYAIHQVVLLASCLLINGTVTLMCLYVPKIYCIYYVDESSIKVQAGGTSSVAATGTTAE